MNAPGETSGEVLGAPNRILERLVQVAPEMMTPTRSTGLLIDDADRFVDADEEIVAVAVGTFGVTRVPALIVLTDRRLLGVTSGGKPRTVLREVIGEITVELPRVSVATPEGPFPFSSPHAAVIADALQASGAALAWNPVSTNDDTTDLSARLSLRVPECFVLGGSGSWSLRVGDPVDVVFALGVLRVDGAAGGVQGLVPATPYEELHSIEIAGRGEVKTGGGFIGGGFGISGAATGIALATVLNMLTTKSSVETLVQIQYADGELFLAHTRYTPFELRVLLSEVFVALRQARR